MVGLISGTGSKLAVLGGILVIAIADAFSDALGIHITEESKSHKSVRDVWEATFSTLFAKFFFAITFIFPVLLFDLKTAMIIDIVWGALLLTIISVIIAREQKTKSWKMVGEHLLIATVVIAISHWAGKIINLLMIE
jgi:VIT1/CCC1 family predicted Fe2+/Mn2+ transporter